MVSREEGLLSRGVLPGRAIFDESMSVSFVQYRGRHDPTWKQPGAARSAKVLAARCVLVAMLIFSGSGIARADTPMPLDRVSLWLGGFYPTVSANLSAYGADSSGSEVDFRRDLGLDKHRVLSNVRLDFLLFDNQGFSVGGYHYSRFASTSLARDIRFAGNDYQADATVAARLSLQTFDASWHWWFEPTPRDAVGFGVGVAYYDLHGVIDGKVDVNGASASARGEADANAFAPLLTVGWKHAFSESFRIFADASGVRKAGGRITGHLLNARIGFEYFPWRNLGVALEYDSNDLNIKADKDSWQGRARIRFRGPAAFVRLRL